MGSPWYQFFRNIQREPDDDLGPAAAYLHVPTGARYEIRDTCVGKGQYGCVFAYDFWPCHGHETPPLGLPRSFCVKRVHREAHAEVTAIAAIDALVSTRPAVRGFVHAAVLSHDTERAEVAMPLYTGTLCKLMNESTPAFAASVVLKLSTTVGMLWSAGLAYTDIKTSNVLYHQSKPDAINVVLGDLGSIVMLRANDGSRPAGIFTFPPQRSVHDVVDEDSTDDGVVQPREADVVWSLGALLMAMTLGTDWLVDRITGTALRGIASERGVDLSAAFTIVADDIEHEADVLRALNGKSGVRCADALEVALAAWFGQESATIASFSTALRGR